MTIEPSRVYGPNDYIPPPSDTPIYDTFNTRNIPRGAPGKYRPYASTGGGPRSNTIRSKLYSPPANKVVKTPVGVPNFLGNRAIIINTWIIAMLIISYDEWHNLSIFPRPARLWKATEAYGLLYLFSLIDALVPLANAFAIGYTIVLLYQYYNGGITPSSAPAGGTGGTNINSGIAGIGQGITSGVGT